MSSSAHAGRGNGTNGDEREHETSGDLSALSASLSPPPLTSDGQGRLTQSQIRLTIREIQACEQLTPSQRGRAMQAAMKGLNATEAIAQVTKALTPPQPSSTTTLLKSSSVAESAVVSSLVTSSQLHQQLSLVGCDNLPPPCTHYKSRKCCIVAACCGKVFSCRLCHDEHYERQDMMIPHKIDRRATRFVICRGCGLRQPFGAGCLAAKRPEAPIQPRSRSRSRSPPPPPLHTRVTTIDPTTDTNHATDTNHHDMLHNDAVTTATTATPKTRTDPTTTARACPSLSRTCVVVPSSAAASTADDTFDTTADTCATAAAAAAAFDDASHSAKGGGDTRLDPAMAAAALELVPSGCTIELFDDYVCSICKLWVPASKRAFHCQYCDMCRVGGRENFFHCHGCSMCIGISIQASHSASCRSDMFKQPCPVCREDLFYSRDSTMPMDCGHTIHLKCFEVSKVSNPQRLDFDLYLYIYIYSCFCSYAYSYSSSCPFNACRVFATSLVLPVSVLQFSSLCLSVSIHMHACVCVCACVRA